MDKFNVKGFSALSALLCLNSALGAGIAAAQETEPEIPRIESVEILEIQPHESDTAVIWFDDFDGPLKNYTESSGDLDSETKFGPSGKSMKCFYAESNRGVGNRKVFFGDSPYGNVVKPGRKFDEIYWRIYVKHQAGWTGGGPAKMSRATSIVSPAWNQAMIAHVWSSGESLTLDPASGVPAGSDQVITTQYNDFDNLRWLGNKPVSQMKISSTAESGWWVCVESRVRLNTPGKNDGENQLWIDGRLECERTGLDWIGSYTGHGINAVFLEAYWNSGSPVDQSRWYDNFAISTRRIGPAVSPVNPVLYKTEYAGPDTQLAWQAEIASDTEGRHIVWRSGTITEGNSVRVDQDNGIFVGPLAGRLSLAAGTKYYTRVRQQSSAGVWSDWSRWHQEFLTEGEPEQAWKRGDINGDGAVSITDVISLLLIQRNCPEDERADYNGDGGISIADVVRLLTDMIDWMYDLSGNPLALASAEG